MRKYRGWMIKCFVLCFFLGLSFAQLRAELSKTSNIPREEQEAMVEALRELMRSEGLSEENLYLQGRFIVGADSQIVADPFVIDGRIFQWGFGGTDPESIKGFAVRDGAQSAEIKDGKLKFAVDKSGAVDFGNMAHGERPLNFGYTGYALHRASYIQVRLRQSAPLSQWKIQYRKEDAPPLESEVVEVKGTEWQEVNFYFGYGRDLGPPVSGVGIVVENMPVPGDISAAPQDTAPVIEGLEDILEEVQEKTDESLNNIEIEWFRPAERNGRAAYRKEITIPSPARWAKATVVSGPFTMYINGQIAIEETRDIDVRNMWNYDLDPALLKEGRNIIAFECNMMSGGMEMRGRMLIDGALVCEDGSYHRFDTDHTWKSNQGLENEDWTVLEYDDSAWSIVNEHAMDLPTGYWFNPGWKGRMTVAPADGREQPVYGAGEDVALDISFPVKEGKSYELRWNMFDQMGDGFRWEDIPVADGVMDTEQRTLKLDSGTSVFDKAGKITFKAEDLKHNHAYALVCRLIEDGVELEKRRYEIAVCGPVQQPVVENPVAFTDGMDLELVWELDTAGDLEQGSFISRESTAAGGVAPNKVVETPLGRFRSTWSETMPGGHGAGYVFMSFKYEVQNPGRPHVILAEYPDDSVRIQTMTVSEIPFPKARIFEGGRQLGTDKTHLGIAPLSHEIRHHQLLFWPTVNEGTVTFFATGLGNYTDEEWNMDKNAKVGTIRIYEVANGVPMRKIEDAPGPRKWIGQCGENFNSILESNVNGPMANHFRHTKRVADIPSFYRYWMMCFNNLITRMRFAGENAVFAGQYQYGRLFTPSEFSEHIPGHDGGDLRDYGVLMSRMMEENDLGWFTHTEMVSFHRLKRDASELDLAEGRPTLGQVDANGRLRTFFADSMVPNYIHPEFRENYFNIVIDEWIALYGQHEGWKGIVMQINELCGPCWQSANADPYTASYDDYTIGLFQKETGIKIPAPEKGIERFRIRKEWLLANAKNEWTRWRCDKMTEIYRWVSDRLKAARPDLQLIIYTQAESYIFPDNFRVDGRPDSEWVSVQEAASSGGLDKDAIRKDKDITLAWSIRDQHASFTAGVGRSALTVLRSRNDSLFSQIADDGMSALGLRNNFWEVLAYIPADSEDAHWPWERYKAHAFEHAPDEYFGEFKVNAFVRGNPTMIIMPLQDFSRTMAREVWMSRFAKAFRALPVAVYERLAGNGRDKNVWIRVAQVGDDVYGYVANNQDWRIDAAIVFKHGLVVRDLMNHQTLQGAEWKLELGPYTIYPFHIANAAAGDVVVSCEAAVYERGVEEVRQLFERRNAQAEQAAGIIKRLNREQDVKDKIAKARAAMDAGDLSGAFDILYASPVLLWVPTLIGDFENKQLVAPRRKGEVKIDGDLSDWPGSPAGVLNSKEQVLIRPGFWSGPDDCSGQFQVMWDDEWIYFAIAVTDDVVVFPDSDKVRINGLDGIELFFSGVFRYGDQRYTDYENHIMVGLPVDGEGGLRLWRRHEHVRNVEVDEIESAWQKTDEGYTIEMKMPRSMLRVPEDAGEGSEIGLDLLINDADAQDAATSVMIWSANRPTCSRDPSRHGIITLGP